MVSIMSVYLNNIYRLTSSINPSAFFYCDFEIFDYQSRFVRFFKFCEKVKTTGYVLVMKIDGNTQLII